MQSTLRAPVTVLSALPVGVWRTYQTVGDLPVRQERVDGREEAPASAGGPLLSACLIVRNEERYLPACLKALTPLVDEIIVVDTGSQDRTREIARAHNARLFDFPWCDDFAAARNESINHARGEWILQIDADEHVQSFSAGRLRQLLQAPDICAYYVLLRRHPGLTPNWQMKLFRNRSEARYSARIHESITPGLLRSITGMHTASVPLLIEHYGYTGDPAIKQARNLPLLLRLLEDEPGQPDKAFIWAHLAEIEEFRGNFAAADEARGKSLATIAAKGAVHPTDCAAYLGYLTSLVARGLEAEALLGRTARLFPENLQLRWIRGHWLIGRGEFAAAAAEFQHLLDRGTDHGLGHWVGYDRRLFGDLSRGALALCESRPNRIT